jgi:glycosyltransferase involved in cell wall biosynthesis
MPSVSICIPTFDRLAYLQESVASARAQSTADVEILIGDDGDSTAIREWSLGEAGRDPRVRYLKTPGRLRLAGNWNFLADRAAGQFLTLIGDDDRLLPEFISRLWGAAQDGADVVFSNHYLIDDGGRRLTDASRQATRHYARDGLRSGQLDDPEVVVWKNSVPMSSAMVRTATVRRLRFREDLNTPELELFVRLAADGGRFAFVDDYLAEYRVHSGSETASGLKIDRLAEYLQAVEVPARVEPIKRALLESMFTKGVDIRLSRGDLPGARALRASPYYPRALGLRAVVQRGVLALPDRAASSSYAVLLACRRVLQRRRSTG